MTVSGKRTLLIVNPGGGDAADAGRRACRTLETGGDRVDFHLPEDPAEISDLIRSLGPASDRIVLGGGDGTFSHSAEALLDAGRPFGILPLGTANDLARTFAIPHEPERAARVVLRGGLRRIDLGIVNGRPFFNVASLGFSVKVANYHTGERKKRLKLLSYPLSWLDAQRDMKPFEARITWNGDTKKTKSTMIAVGNGVHYGGGLTIADDAAIDDGWLDVYYVKPLGPWGMLKLLPYLKFGALKRRQDVRTLRAAAVRVETTPTQEINVDGDVIAETPADFSVLPKALEVFVPATK
ncbi:lipid kinase [Minwuia thermotolerans]|uniref:Lipid kinase n=1 Tax=Minwuia thermotolerans TaxID=2056226 RepID=A0A2M9G2B2_9PROT|nr:lipid kinase [Minwuia thermotolerans]